MSKTTAEVLIVGGGIVGLTIARELIQKGYKDIVIIDKEKDLGKHASGRNSGVLHAGIYYTPDSLKARSCLNGNFLMRTYCKTKGLPILETGKVIVTRSEKEIPTLKELYRRALANGAKVHMVNEQELSDIEPNARTVQQAIYSHQTAVVDPKKVILSLETDLTASGKVKFLLNCGFLGIKGSSTAKGIYKKLIKDKTHLVRGNIYPVPDIRNPFLGIHFTRSVHGEVYLGPTAIPALGRENYGILEGINAEAFSILFRDAVLFCANPKFRDVALSEPKKYLTLFFFNSASKLVKELELKDIEPADKVGIRAQLVDWDKKELVVDFLVAKQGESVHILNPVSPAFTSSMDLARTIVRDYFS
jgi:L-2-hydroxyglutarate oxidase